MVVKTVQEHIHIFMMKLLKADYAASVQSLPGTAAVVNAVKKDVNGIGYGGAAYAVGVKHAKLKKMQKHSISSYQQNQLAKVNIQ